MIVSAASRRPSSTGRGCTVESGFTTKTYGPCWPGCIACDGTTIADSVVSVSTTSTYCPGHSAFSALSNVPLSWMVPVVGSTVLFTNVSRPTVGLGAPGGVARTDSGPAAMYCLIADRCCCGTVNET